MAAYNERLEDLLDHHLISNEMLVKRKRLGGVGYVINGNMCLGIFDDKLVARIGKDLAHHLKEKAGVSLYVSGDQKLEEFVLVEPQIYHHSKALQKFIRKAIQYTSALPPKDQSE